jgi:hypothetical protein
MRKKDKQNPLLAPDRPTFGQFLYWLMKLLHPVESLEAREGARRFALRYRSVLGESTSMSDGPGALVQADSAIVDVWLVNSMMRWMLIGRPIIYVIIDVFSRLIVGLHIALEGPSWLGMSQAIANAMTDKVEFCARYGIAIKPEQWPSKHVWRSMLGDRAELISKASDQLENCFHITVKNTASYRADWKGIIEQYFRILNLERIHFLPGAVRARELERGERDYRLDAKLTMYEFTKIVIYEVLKYNNYHYMDWYPRNKFMIEQNVKAVPITLWDWGMKNGSGLLKQFDPTRVKLGLMPRDEATITRKGVRFKGKFYGSDFLLKSGWYTEAAKNGTWKITAARDPRRIETIYLILSDKEFHVCELLERENKYIGHFEEDILDLMEWEKMMSDEHESTERQESLPFDTATEAIIAEATEKTNAAIPNGISKRERTQGRRQSRAEENSRVRTEEAWNLGEASSQPAVAVTEEELPENDDWEKTVETSKRKDLDVIKNSLKKGDPDEN